MFVAVDVVTFFGYLIDLMAKCLSVLSQIVIGDGDFANGLNTNFVYLMVCFILFDIARDNFLR